MQIQKISIFLLIAGLFTTLLLSHLGYSSFIVNSGSSIFSTAIAIFLFYFFKKEKGYSFIAIAVYVTIGLIIVEVLQLFILWSTFDYFDILGCVIGFIVALFIQYISTLKETKDVEVNNAN